MSVHVNSTPPTVVTAPNKEGVARESVVIALSPELNFDTAGYLSPDDLVAWAARELGELDSGIREHLADVQERKRLAQALQNGIGQLNAAKGEKKGNHAELEATYRGLAESTDNATLKQAFTQVADAFEAGKPLSDKKIAAMAQQLEARMQEHTNSAEISMLHMQSKVQKRTHALSFVSNVIRAMDEAAKTTIGNMR